MTTPATITRRPGPLFEELGQNAFDSTTASAFVLQWLAVREDVVGYEVALNHALEGTGWEVAGPIEATGEGTWSVDLVAGD